MMLLFVAIASAHCSSGPPPPVDARPYEEQVLAFRASKDADFRNDPASPLPANERAAFAGLPYYPVQPDYRVPAVLTEEQSSTPVVISLPNSAREIEQKVRVGTLTFTLAGKPQTLSAFAESSNSIQRLWVPFHDLTNGFETYGGGRYLDLDRTATGVYDLDFNRAYHPFCVYSIDFVCPLPPRENRLGRAIRAGERLKAQPRTE